MHAKMATLLAVARHVGTASLSGIIAGIVVGGVLGRVDPFNFDFRRFGVAARVTDALAWLAIAPAVLTAALIAGSVARYRKCSATRASPRVC